MHLYYSHTSPYARKVSMFLHYSGLIDHCQLHVLTFESDELRKHNPLGKIPALVDGELNLFESDLILEYLDDKHALNGAPSTLNRGEVSYYAQRKQQAYANGILEAAVHIVMETRRSTEHSEYWLGRWHEAITASLVALDVTHVGSAEKPNMATFTLAAALGYLDFRLPQLNWSQHNPELVPWFAAVEECEWFIQTAPPSGN